MGNRWTTPERLIVALLAAIAALTFFFPLLSISLPIAGDQEVTGYDTASKIRQLTHEVRSASGHGDDGKPSIKLPRPPRGNASSVATLPASVRFSWLIPVFVVGAFGCALLTVLGSLVSLPVARIASTLGTACGVLALLHLTVMNSDIHSVLNDSVQRWVGGRKENPLRGLAQTLGSVLVGGVSLTPGAGLYVLAVSLGLAALVTHSRLLSRIHLADRSRS